MISSHQEVAQYLKKNDIVLYEKYKPFLDKPAALLEEIIRHYQWIFEIQDFSKLNLQDICNRNHLNLFIYVFEQKPELANDFINHFVQSFRNSFDYVERKWSADLIFNTIIHQCSNREFDLLAMYALVGATYDRFSHYLIRLHVDPSLNLRFKEVVQFFELIINQSFFDELKAEVDVKRQNSFYFKPSDTPITLPTQRVVASEEDDADRAYLDNDTREQLEMLKRAQANSEAEFSKWDKADKKAQKKLAKKAKKENPEEEKPEKKRFWLIKPSSAKKLARLESRHKHLPLTYDNIENTDDIVPKTDVDRQLVLKSLRSYAKRKGLNVSYRDLIEQESDGGMIGYTPAHRVHSQHEDVQHEVTNQLPSHQETAIDDISLQPNIDTPIEEFDSFMDNEETMENKSSSNKFAPRPDIKIIKIRRY